ncbi:putative carboxypeptidase (chromatophore) [Paulinella micropora]|uniref:Carboxypeptidase n=1 Tax=Paulinella micropora TaxID=1928728 RepID=A0A5K7VSC7_9EUKA|nr:putative carboxypeptidase [Paulinella micropora]
MNFLRLLLINFCTLFSFFSVVLRNDIWHDIPVAHRSYNPHRRSFTSSRFIPVTLIGICSLCITLVFGSGVLVSDPNIVHSKRLPPPSSEGRLFGHFRYEEARKDQLTTIAPGIELRSAAATMFEVMKRDAEREGVNLQILSGFRSTNLQHSIFFDIKANRNQTAYERAKVSAPPGYSEHATGFAIDIGDGNDPDSNFSKSFENTLAFEWLQINANRYSFTLSFPPNNSQRIAYEPWHWRFEGSVEALEIFAPTRS